jgi:hypothetical protein
LTFLISISGTYSYHLSLAASESLVHVHHSLEDLAASQQPLAPEWMVNVYVKAMMASEWHGDKLRMGWRKARNAA